LRKQRSPKYAVGCNSRGRERGQEDLPRATGRLSVSMKFAAPWASCFSSG